MTPAEAATRSHCAIALENGRWRVPCVRVQSTDKIDAPVAWWPIMGPLHEDRAIIGFDEQHFHIDWRFVGATLRGIATRYHTWLPTKVITARMIQPIEPTGTGDRTQRHGLPEGPTEQWLRHELRRPNQTPAPQWPPETAWLKALETHFSDAQLGGTSGWRCPHQGAELAGLVEEGNETVRCPLHGLTWCVHTRRLVKRAKAQAPPQTRMVDGLPVPTD